MLRNNKGFTVIELIMSFLFASILALTLFSVIVTYRGKQQDTVIESRLLAFKSQIVIDVQEDIQLKGLKEINYCPGNEAGSILSRCVILSYNDNTTKVFEVDFDNKVDVIKNNDGTQTQFYYKIPFIRYGDIRYDIPDATSIYIDDDYILQTTGLYDGIETGTKLYKIEFNLKHNDLDTNVNISIVANGTQAVPSTGGPYKTYNIGALLDIQINDQYQRKFRVIQASNSYMDYVTLLYDDVYDNNLLLNSTDYNVLENYSNRYDNSKIKAKVYAVNVEWKNADEVRLITTEELLKISSAFCPQYSLIDSGNISLATAPSWVTNKSYWTMSEKLVSGNNNGKKVWVVDGNSKILTSAFVNANYAIRPVIVIKKTFIANL